MKTIPLWLSLWVAIAMAQSDDDSPFDPNPSAPEAHIGQAPDYTSNATATTISRVQSPVLEAGACYESPYKGSKVRVNGTVSGIGETQFFLQDSTSGIRVDNQLFLPRISVGDEVSIVASVQESKGETELVDVAELILKNGTNTPVVPSPTTTGDIGSSCNEDGEAWEGALVTLTNAVVTTGKPEGISDFVKIDDGSGFTYIARTFLAQRFMAASLQDVAGYEFLMGLTFNQVTGVVRYVDDKFVVYIRSIEDVDAQPFVPVETSAPTPEPTRAPVPTSRVTNAPTTIGVPLPESSDPGISQQNAAGIVAGGIVAGALVGLTCTLGFKRKKRPISFQFSRLSLRRRSRSTAEDEIDDVEEKGGAVIVAKDEQCV